MSCEICLLDSAVDPAILSCAGCSRIYHAACVGIPSSARAGIPISTRSSLRKKEKTMDVLDFVLPCCKSCQNLITLNFDFHLLVEQQRKLADDINSNTQVLHTSNKLDKMDMVHEAIDRIEGLLVANKKEVMASRDTDVTSAIKNHLTDLFDISMQASKDNIAAFVQDLTTNMTRELKGIYDEFEKIGSLAVEMAHHCTEHNSSQPIVSSLDIMDELKSITSAVSKLGINNASVPSSDSSPNLMDELTCNVPASVNSSSKPSCSPPELKACSSKTNSDASEDSNSGENDDETSWRVMGPNKVLCTESEYIELKRAQQEKAMRRRKAGVNNSKISKTQNRHKPLNYHSHNNKHSNNANNKNNNNNTTTNNNKNNNYNNSNKIHNNINTNRHQNYNNNGNMNNKTVVKSRNNNNYNNRSHTKHYSTPMCSNSHFNNTYRASHNGYHTGFLPTDKDLLAAAKTTFSRPIQNRGINFQRGETLNPYKKPTALQESSSSSPNWTFGPALRSSFSNHCASCSCQQSGF